ncbi:MAG: TIGR04255 family protein [Aestuariivirga sp.]|uniref:TIGR04255 family protein n=1 Tax=Aestuariivirga sp. TaxID=2650926 RepID=UPI0025BEC434|nr:TIGR04255 family protein [Aestuariivirga sp.]MCA3560519.1 TIGR04255 family protein [Aestuariivirga sp.]
MFETLYPEHAIERCTVSLSFDAPVPAKAREKALSALRSDLQGAGFGEGKSMGFRFGNISGQLKVELDDAPVKFELPSGGIEIVIFPDALIYTTQKYVRWRPFFGQFRESLSGYMKTVTEILSMRALRLEYVDRFIWTGSWDDIDYGSLLRADSNLIAPLFTQAKKQWHSHAGLFEFPRSAERRLMQVNVDATDALSQSGSQPSIGILTLIQDEFIGANNSENRFKEFEGCMDAVEELHVSSKDLFSRVIVADMAARINLNSRGS